MTEEKAAEEAEVVEELEDTLDQVEEEGQVAETSVEEEEEQEAEEEVTDERGVPLKNRIAELERKLNAADVREASYKELLTTLNTGTKKEQEAAQETLRSYTAADFAKVNIDADTADLLLKAFNREIDIRIAGADKQTKVNATTNQEYTKTRNNAIAEATASIGDEFGVLAVVDEQGVKFDLNSPIFKRAKEIYINSPTLRNQIDGEAVAAYRAATELTKEKYGKAPPTKKPGSKAEAQKGKGSGRGGGSAKAVKVGGKFHRKLTVPEWDKLSKEDKSAYNVWQTDQDTK